MFRFAKPFLMQAFLYIDKPLALSEANARKIIDTQLPGQIFSCSALRYAKEFAVSSSQLEQLGKIKYLIGSTPKDWNKYSIHVIEPMLRLFPELSELSVRDLAGLHQIELYCMANVHLVLNMKYPPSELFYADFLRIIGDKIPESGF